jgi:hypothetical protein
VGAGKRGGKVVLEEKIWSWEVVILGLPRCLKIAAELSNKVCDPSQPRHGGRKNSLWSKGRYHRTVTVEQAPRESSVV